jgi:hypothetical protein
MSETEAWIDKQGDVWRLGEDGLMHTFETAPFPRAYVERKWGPLKPFRGTDERGSHRLGEHSSNPREDG